MFYETEYPKVYSTSNIFLDILSKPIKWFKPYSSSLGQLILYRFKVKPKELRSADNILNKQIIRMRDGSEILIGVSTPSRTPRAVVLYLHTVCGDYTQLAHMGKMFMNDNIAYVSYTRSGNDPSLSFSKFNFIGRIDELQVVIQYICSIYPGVPIHAVGASAGSALLIRYLGGYNHDLKIRSAVLVSPGYNFMKSFQEMGYVSKSYLINKMKYTVRNCQQKEELSNISSLEGWVCFQSKLLGYKSPNDYIANCDPVNYLHRINVPTLFLSSLDDNVFQGNITSKFTHLPTINSNIIIVTTNRGGHSMFEDDGYAYPWSLRVIREWVDNRIT